MARPQINTETNARCQCSTACRALKPLELSQSQLHELFEFESGELYWKVKRKSVNPGDLAGGLSANGYWRIKIDGRTYKRSRLVWLYVHGTDNYPLYLDHINRDRSDDRIENLRLVTHGENQRNRAWGESKYRYVYREASRWRARVSTHRGRVNLGCFKSEIEAIAAVRKWEELSGHGSCNF